jgi:hypothetical protein
MFLSGTALKYAKAANTAIGRKFIESEFLNPERDVLQASNSACFCFPIGGDRLHH